MAVPKVETERSTLQTCLWKAGLGLSRCAYHMKAGIWVVWVQIAGKEVQEAGLAHRRCAYHMKAGIWVVWVHIASQEVQKREESLEWVSEYVFMMTLFFMSWSENTIFLWRQVSKRCGHPAPGGHRGAQAKLPYSHNHPAGITQGSLGPPERTTLWLLPGPWVWAAFLLLSLPYRHQALSDWPLSKDRRGTVFPMSLQRGIHNPDLSQSALQPRPQWLIQGRPLTSQSTGIQSEYIAGFLLGIKTFFITRFQFVATWSSCPPSWGRKGSLSVCSNHQNTHTQNRKLRLGNQVLIICLHPDQFNPWVGKIPWRKAQQPTPVSLPENPMDRGAWQVTVCEAAESERTKQLTCSLHFQALPEATPALCSSKSLKILSCWSKFRLGFPLLTTRRILNDTRQSCQINT